CCITSAISCLANTGSDMYSALAPCGSCGDKDNPYVILVSALSRLLGDVVRYAEKTSAKLSRSRLRRRTRSCDRKYTTNPTIPAKTISPAPPCRCPLRPPPPPKT